MSSDSRKSDDDGESGGTTGPVSRRRFVRAAGATGAAGLVAGCSTQDPDASGTEGSGGTDAGGATTGDSGSGGGATVEIATADIQGHREGFRQALHEGGLPDDIRVTFLATSGLSGDTQSQYRQWLQAGRATPDIMRMDSGWTIPFIQRGSVVNLDEELPTETVQTITEDYFPASVRAVSGSDDSIYGVPYQIGLPTIQYRKDLVEAAGFSPEENNWATNPLSWKRFSQVVSQTLSQASDVEYGYSWQASNYVGLSCCTFNEIMSSWGGAYFGGMDTLYGPVGERPITVDGEQVLQALRMGRTLINGEGEHSLDGYASISPTNVLQWTEGPSKSQFIDGNAVALRYWPTGISQAAAEFGEDLGVMPIPYGVQPSESQYEGLGGSCAALGGWNMVLNPNSKNRDAATQVLQAITSEPFRRFQLQELDLLPPDAAILEGGNIAQGTVWSDYTDTLTFAGENAVPRPVTAVWPDESTAIADKVNSVLAGQQAPDPAMSELKSTLEQIESSV